jgi:hypothetical protein
LSLDNIKPKLHQLETLRNELINKGLETFSFHQRLSDLLVFFEKVISTSNISIIESYLTEFIDEYLLVVSHFDCFCVEPCFSEKLIDQLLSIINFPFFESEKHKIQNEIDRINIQLNKLKDSLDGKVSDISSQPKSYFPLIDRNASDGFYGLLESVSVRINKASDKDSFLFIPSEKQIEEKLAGQCKKSWKLAITTIRKYVRRPFKYHEVIISFDKKIGFYEGESLGVALALTFIEELLKFYNPPFQILNKSQSAFTGGVTEQGKVLNTGEDIIKQKVKAVFFSDVKNFVIPKLEETYAQFALTQLKEKYPNRNLKIIPVEDFDDILNRRDLVEIKRINPIKRTGRFLRKNWVSSTFLIIILALIYFANLWDFDDNPQVLKYENQYIKVQNKNGKTLWSIKVYGEVLSTLNYNIVKKRFGILIDINGDNINEVIFSSRLINENDPELYNLVCYDNKFNRIWRHSFSEIVSTNSKQYSDNYIIYIIGLTKYNNKDILIVTAKNIFFPSAVFGIDIKTGERVTDILWHSGHFADGIILKDSISNKEKIILGGINNGLESAVLAVVDIEKLKGQVISAENYLFGQIPFADLDKYIMIKPTDLSKALGNRYNAVLPERIELVGNLISVAVNENSNDENLGKKVLYYYFNRDFTLNFIESGDSFQTERDKLVLSGKLSPPLTYTKEYFDKLYENVFYYEKGNWVRNKNSRKIIRNFQ